MMLRLTLINELTPLVFTCDNVSLHVVECVTRHDTCPLRVA
jgi:hypothetical protein